MNIDGRIEESQVVNVQCSKTKEISLLLLFFKKSKLFLDVPQ